MRRGARGCAVRLRPGWLVGWLLIGAAGCGASAVPPPEAPPAPRAEKPAAPPLAALPGPGAVAPTAPEPDAFSASGALGGLSLEQELEDVTFRQTRGLVTEWELHAARVQQRPQEPAHLVEVTLQFFGEDPRPTIVTADEADYDPASQDATLRGHVHIAAPNGDTLDSTILYWSGANRKLRTDGRVTLRRGESHITATGMETSPGLQDVKLFQVHGVLHDAELAG